MSEFLTLASTALILGAAGWIGVRAARGRLHPLVVGVLVTLGFLKATATAISALAAWMAP